MPSVRPRFEVADVIRRYGGDFRGLYPPSAAAERVLNHLADCRTAALGGHLDECADCGHTRISYNSCRDRHCPKCQATRQAEWIQQRLARLLPVPYFHVVFTIPGDLNALALGNKQLLYNILFAAASKTLLAIAADPKHLGTTPGITAVLHSWGQNLSLHPHLHCVVTGGGLANDGSHFLLCKQGYLLPVPVLAKLFRGKFLDQLHRAWLAGKLDFGGSTTSLAHPNDWYAFKDRLYRKHWVVYAKRPFGGPRQVFNYLGRYTHRVAIANHRIRNIKAGRVHFSYKDYADGAKKKICSLDANEFLRRFLLHTLPKGFTRIRHYGLHAPRNVNTKLAQAQQLLGRPKTEPISDDEKLLDAAEKCRQLTGIDPSACPCCNGKLIRKEILPPLPRPPPIAYLNAA